MRACMCVCGGGGGRESNLFLIMLSNHFLVASNLLLLLLEYVHPLCWTRDKDKGRVSDWRSESWLFIGGTDVMTDVK